MGRRAFISSWLDLLLVLGSLVATGWAKYVPFLQPGFFFDYNIAGQPVPIPITQQCETIHLKWDRANAIGQNPVAPYSMLVYTSTSTTPYSIAAGDGLSFDWQVPFSPGTQYQICMWDKNGVPGGCQAMYTVVQNTTVANPTCKNVTAPIQLIVDATQAVPAGPMSRFGFIDQCTDLFVTPKQGKPPFTLTVAPALHPPYNITSNSMDPIDWTVSLSWSFPFFLSLVSADGQMWSNGPLHAGGFGPSDCLAPGTVSSSRAHTVAVGAGLGGAFAAAILGALGTFLYLRLRHKSPQIDAFDTRPPNDSDPTQQRYSQPATAALSWTAVSDARASQIISPSAPRGRTYVLHHDAGQAPITVITDSAEVVELPPQYRRDSDVVPLPPVREKAEPLSAVIERNNLAALPQSSSSLPRSPRPPVPPKVEPLSAVSERDGPGFASSSSPPR